MASMVPNSYNPFEAPTAALTPTFTGSSTSEAERLRYEYLGHEASVRSVGTLCCFFAICAGIALVGCTVAIAALSLGKAAEQPNLPVDPRLMLGVVVALALVFCVLYATVGLGLRRLLPWSRWLMAALCGLSLLFNGGSMIYTLAIQGLPPAGISAQQVGNYLGALFNLGITAFILYMMVSAAGAVVFSGEYREAVRLTPAIRRPTSLFAKVLSFGIVGLIILAFVVGAMIGPK